MRQEIYQPGQNIKVPSCEKCIPFCEVSTRVIEMREDGDRRVPLRTPNCECTRPPDEVEIIPHKLF